MASVSAAFKEMERIAARYAPVYIDSSPPVRGLVSPYLSTLRPELHEWRCVHSGHPFDLVFREHLESAEAYQWQLSISAEYPLAVGPEIRMLPQGTMRSLFASLGWIQDLEVGHPILDFQKTIQSEQPEAAIQVLQRIANDLVANDALPSHGLGGLPRFGRQGVELDFPFVWGEPEIHRCVDMLIRAVTTDLYGLATMREVPEIIEHKGLRGELPTFTLEVPAKVEFEFFAEEGRSRLRARTEYIGQDFDSKGEEVKRLLANAKAQSIALQDGHLWLVWERAPEEPERIMKAAHELGQLASATMRGGVYR